MKLLGRILILAIAVWLAVGVWRLGNRPVITPATPRQTATQTPKQPATRLGPSNPSKPMNQPPQQSTIPKWTKCARCGQWFDPAVTPYIRETLHDTVMVPDGTGYDGTGKVVQAYSRKHFDREVLSHQVCPQWTKCARCGQMFDCTVTPYVREIRYDRRRVLSGSGSPYAPLQNKNWPSYVYKNFPREVLSHKVCPPREHD